MSSETMSLPSLDREILATLCEFASTTPERLRPSQRLREDLGLDSVTSMELLSHLAERYDLDLGLEEAMKVTTVGELLEVAARTAERRR